MFDSIKKNPNYRVLHIDLMCNAGPHWSRQIAAMSGMYMFVDSNNHVGLTKALDAEPTHIVYGGGFWNSALYKTRLDEIVSHLKTHPRCITWGYWGDGTMSLIENPIDYVFADVVFCSSTNAVKLFQELGFKAEFAVHPIDSNIYYKHKQINEIYDWNFIGTNYGTTRREHVAIAKTVSNKHLIMGRGHKPVVPVASFEETANYFRQSKITLNINDDKYTHLGQYFSDRLLMAMFVGKFVLTTYQPGLEKMFTRGGHLDWYTGEEELVEKMDLYLNNQRDRNRIAFSGHRFVSNRYSIGRMIPGFFSKAEKYGKRR